MARPILWCAWLAQMRVAASDALSLTLLSARLLPESHRCEPTSRELELAVLVPAHNEAAAVSTAVTSLLRQDYPEAKRRVIVIADNCDDRTAQIAMDAGAVVWTRTEPDHRGKGAALDWALARLHAEEAPIDAVVIVDADCEASPSLLGKLAGALAAGADAAQSNYVVSNPEESPTSGLRAAAFALRHDVRSGGRRRLGLSPGLFGTGMAFTVKVVSETEWSTSLTEDSDLYLRLVELGRRIDYIAGASVASAMPTSAEGARSQQLRWETGNAEIRRRRVRRLWLQGLRERDLEKLGAAAEHSEPSQTARILYAATVGLVGLAFGDRRLVRWSVWGMGTRVLFVIVGSGVAGQLASLVRGAAGLPAFLAGRLDVLLAVRRGRGARTWERTIR